jgi:hypothetical protein
MDSEIRIICAVFQVPSLQGKALAALLRHRVASTERLALELGIRGERVRAVIHHLRAALREHNVSIQTQCGIGYHLRSEDRQRVLALIERFRQIETSAERRNSSGVTFEGNKSKRLKRSSGALFLCVWSSFAIGTRQELANRHGIGPHKPQPASGVSRAMQGFPRVIFGRD